MKQTISNSVSDLFQAAGTGPFLKAEIVSLTGNGKLRVTCNWLYSSLNCDPNDDSAFSWQFNKIDDQTISLSPANSCISKTIYASVRDDIDWYLQVQAPYSADWITAVGRDEEIKFVLHDLSIGQFNGFNGDYLTLNSSESNHGGHSGYRVRSIGTSFDEAAQWFISVQNTLQEGLEYEAPIDRFASLQEQLNNCNISLEDEKMECLRRQLNG